MKEQVQRFNEAHSSIQINRQRIPTGGYYDKVFTALSGQNAPELMIMNGGPLYDNKRYFMPINQFVDDINSFTSDYYKPGILERCMYDGTAYALPLKQHMKLMYYNVELFEQAGLDPKSKPVKLKEFKQVCNTIKSETEAWPFTGAAYAAFDIHMLFMSLINQGGGSYVSDDKKTITWDSDIGVEQAEFIRSIPTRGWDTVGLASNKGVKKFRAGKMAMIHNGPWFYGVANDQDFEWDVFDPAIAPSWNRHGQWAGMGSIAITHPKTRKTPSDKKTQAAFEATKWLTQNSEPWGTLTGQLPAYKPAATSSEVKNSQAWKDQLKTINKMTEQGDPVGQPLIPKQGSVLEPLISSLGEMYSHKISAEKAVSQSAKKAQDVLDQAHQS